MSESSTQRFLKPVVTLLYVNLALSVVLAALTFLFEHSILDYQLLHLESLGQVSPGDEAATRGVLENVLWIRPVSVLLIAVIYVRLAARMKLGRRRTYVRLLVIAIAGFLGLAYLVVTAEFPLWMRIGEVVQAVVLLGLLYAVSTKDVRSHFAKKPVSSVEA